MAAVLATLGILIAVDNFASPPKTLAVGISFYVFYVLLSTKWSSRRAPWFWPTVLVLATLHAAVIIFLDLKLPPGPALVYVAPVMFVDGFAMLGILTWLEHRSARGSDS